MDEALLRIVYERLNTSGLDEEWSTLVIAACEGADELAHVLGGSSQAITERPGLKPKHGPAVRAFLAGVTAQGFRGIGPETTLSLSPGPGLTLVVGRNGSGKSSFAEGLEVLFTGDSGRWAGRSKVWKEGWRNLHHSHPALVEAELWAEDRAPTRVTRTWDRDADVDSGKVVVQEHGKPKGDLSSLGWTAALSNYRPFLSYNELGSMLDEGPSKLYDALSIVLGLEDLVEAQKLLADERLSRKKALDEARAAAQVLIARAQELVNPDDDRPSKALGLLDRKQWDIDELEKLSMGHGESSEGSVIDILRRSCAVETPDLNEVHVRAERLSAAVNALNETKGTDSARALEMATLLAQALEFHHQHKGDECPVCKSSGRLDSTWRERTEKEVERLRAEAKEATAAQEELRFAIDAARQLLVPIPQALVEAGSAGIAVDEAVEAWSRWTDGLEISDPADLAAHLELEIGQLHHTVKDACGAAQDELRRRDDKWTPLARDILAWIDSARTAQSAVETISSIKKAEAWFKNAATDIRNERFAPIAEKATAMWESLRQQSNVKLGTVALSGTGPFRKVELHVTVDDVEGAALSVMSQGELNALALSLFLPRATMTESPFGFIVIDDPVQSMDPSRVDGLARVLENAATTHQVIVFTHDDRLPEAARRLGVDTRMIEVHRRQNSTVELREARHPVTTYIEDAFTLAKTSDLPAHVARQVVPGFCRSAVEAACIEIVRRRRLRRGTPHTEVEELLVHAGKLRALLALALFDDPEKSGDVTTRLNKEFGKSASETFAALNKGVHEGSTGDLTSLARDAEKLANGILRLKT